MAEERTLIFTYGTLKRNLPNHRLLSSAAGVALLSPRCVTSLPFPLVVGPNGIPFLLPLPGLGLRVYGELYSVSAAALAAVDDLEGIGRGHYERSPVRVTCEGEGEEREAMAYFADRGFGEKMWRRVGGMEGAIEEYTAAEAAAYVSPAERPAGSAFLDDVRRFLGESE